MTLVTNYKPQFSPHHMLSPSARSLNERMEREDGSPAMNLCVLYNDDVTCSGYVVLVTDEYINTQHWWNSTDRAQPKALQKILSHSTLSHFDWPVIGQASVVRDRQITACAMT
jgi:hypothetical protein